jgi:acyl-coenzyme A thioesterase PaaI-like protein
MCALFFEVVRMSKQSIRAQVLRGLALNREPGLHFAGNFLEASFDHVGEGRARISLHTGPHCEELDGQADLGSVAMLADIALASSIRAGLAPTTRLATVSMHLQFTGAPLTGRLEAAGAFEGFLQGASGQHGLSRVCVASRGEPVCFGSGAFVAIKPPPGITLHPVARVRAREVTALSESELKRDEIAILRHADDALAKADAKQSFIRAFWGYEPRMAEGGASGTMKTGPHVGNRVGHVQGGLLVGFAAANATASLPASWMLSAVSAWFVSPGEGAALHAKSKVLHHGRLTAVVRTEVTGEDKQRVLEAVTTHARHAVPASDKGRRA